MRHNQNARRSQRGRGNGGNYNGGGGHHNNNGQRRVNPRIQNFDSNGPDVRIRGTAYQINEKYVALARDAAAAGDRVLAESYLQHAEHYQRFINEMTEEQQQYQAQQQAHQQAQHGQHNAEMPAAGEGEQPVLEDLDQAFLRAPRHGSRQEKADTAEAAAPVTTDPAEQEQPRIRTRRTAEAEG